MTDRGIEERVSTLEAEVAGLGNTVTVAEQHQRELIAARFDAFSAQIEKLDGKIDGLKSRKGETHEEFDRRIATLERHTEEHCDELEEVRSSIRDVATDVSSLLDRSRSWKSYLIPVAVAVTALVAGLGANAVVDAIRAGAGG